MIPAIWNYLVGYLVGTWIAVIGLYIAFIPVILRFRVGDKFERGAWSLGKHYKWIDAIAIVWVAFISILFLLPTATRRACRGRRVGLGGVVNYAPMLVGGALLLFGGWWASPRTSWFKGPVRMGSEEELEQIEQRLEDSTRMRPEPAA